MNKKVSILMAVFNGQKYINDSIISVINQTHPYWELIIINDGSTDNTRSIIQNYQSFLPEKVKILNKDKNAGKAAALNSALPLVTGEYVAFLDADDIYQSNKLERQIEFAQKNSTQLLYGDMTSFDSKGNFKFYSSITFSDTTPAEILRNSASLESFPRMTPKYILARNTKPAPLIPSCSVLLDARVFESVRFDEILPASQDYDLWFQVIGQGYSVDYLPGNTYFRRMHDEQITKDSEKMERAAQIVREKIIRGSYFG